MTKKIALIGPAYPYRGGIAQYTSELYDALSKETDTVLYSFKRLYPPWLYPGESDKEIDTSTVVAKQIIDVYNPLSLITLCSDIEKEGCDVAIITWWTLIWQPGMAYIARRLRKKGIKTVFLCHNLYDHDSKGVKQQVSKKLLNASDAYIVHSSDEEELLNEIFPGKQVFRRLLPIYAQFPKATKKLKKRGDLELLYFGFIRPYKGLDVLLKSLSQFERDVYVTIVGEYWGDKAEIEEKIVSSNYKNVTARIEYVTMEEAANYFEQADVVALPYISATGSAVLAVAYHYKVPVIASSIGGLKDGVLDGTTGWLVEPGSAYDIAKTVNSIDRKKAAGMKSAIEQFGKDNSWSAFARHLTKFIDKL